MPAHVASGWKSVTEEAQIINQNQKNYGKARHLETGDSDTHHHPYRHRNEPGSGELHVGGPLNPQKGEEPHLPQG